MTRPLREGTLIQEREATPGGQQGLAAARLAMKVRGILHQALEASPLTQKQLADSLGVGESRVSQIFSGNGNVQISTLAKVLRGMGYKVEISAIPVDSSVSPLPQRRERKNPRHEKRMHTDTVTVTRGGTSGMSVATIDFQVPVEDSSAFYEVSGSKSTVRRPSKKTTGEIDWEAIDWDTVGDMGGHESSLNNRGRVGSNG